MPYSIFSSETFFSISFSIFVSFPLEILNLLFTISILLSKSSLYSLLINLKYRISSPYLILVKSDDTSNISSGKYNVASALTLYLSVVNSTSLCLSPITLESIPYSSNNSLYNLLHVLQLTYGLSILILFTFGTKLSNLYFTYKIQKKCF